MYKKPLLFIVLATAHIIEPFIKVLYFKLTTSFSFNTVISNIAQIQTPRELFDFWLLFPLGGLALISVKKWSYPIFVGVQAYSIYAHLTYEKYTWPYLSEVPFISSLALLVMNALIIIYFALPDVRRPFFDRSVRWWETRKRHSMRIPISFTIRDQQQSDECEILNISESGIFMNSQLNLDINTVINISIRYQDFEMSIEGIIRSQHSFDHEQGLGVKFKFNNIWQKLYTRKMVRQIAKDLEQKHKDDCQEHEQRKVA